MCCGKTNSKPLNMKTTSGKNASNPFTKSSTVKTTKSAGSFGKPTIKTNFKIGRG